MNRSALQFSLRAFFVAGVFCALFCVFCGYAMWFCWDLKNTCRLQISEIRYLRECVERECRHTRRHSDDTSGNTFRYARLAQSMRDETKLYCEAMQAARNPSAKFKIGQEVSIGGENCNQEAFVVGDFFDGTYLVAIRFSRRTVHVAEENLAASNVEDGK